MFAVISPTFLFTQHFCIMRTSKERQSLSDFVKFHGKEQLVKSLHSVHNHVIYGQSKRLSRKKRDELHDLKLLADQISRLDPGE
jgi:hypothetical protein